MRVVEVVEMSAAAQSCLLADAIGRRTEVTVLRNGALVDAVALPTELPD